MKIVVFGLNFKTAPVELRERLTLTGSALITALDTLCAAAPDAAGDQGASALDEAVILSTCNRLEVYAASHEHSHPGETIADRLATICVVNRDELIASSYQFTDDAAVLHLMRVACGLDSMILGETQILGQVAEAYESAHNAGSTGPNLSHLFAQAIHAGKRARTESAISRYTTSVSHAAALRLTEALPDPSGANVLIVGAGETAVLAAQSLRRQEIGRLTFINRTLERAEELAVQYGGKALTWRQLDEALVWADACICATGAPHTVIYRQDIEGNLAAREGRPLVFLDIAVPRDVEASVGELPGVTYFDIDDLQSVVDANMELRRAVVPQVEEIIRDEMTRFTEWYRGRQVLPVIRDLREWATHVGQQELEQTLHRLPDADERTRRAVERLVHQLVNRLLHEPTTRLRLQALEGNGYGYAYALRELFALENSPTVQWQCDSTTCPAYPTANGNGFQCSLQCILPEDQVLGV